MSVRHSLLALLAEQPAHGYGLKSSFEKNTGGTWPLNVGQVYTTLNRLERDGLVVSEGIDDSDRQTWRLTQAGKKALAAWYAAPVVDDPPTRDELALKVLLAASAGAAEASAVIQSQRVATLERLQQYTRLKRDADPSTELPFTLLIDALVLKAEAELKWLDRCEERLRRRKS